MIRTGLYNPMTSVSKLKNVYSEDFRGADKVAHSKSAKILKKVDSLVFTVQYPNPRTT